MRIEKSLKTFSGNPSEYDGWRTSAAFFAMQTGKLANWEDKVPKLPSLSGMSAAAKADATEVHEAAVEQYDSDTTTLVGALMAAQAGDAADIAQTYFKEVQAKGDGDYSVKELISRLDEEFWDRKSMSPKFVCLMQWLKSSQGNKSFNVYASEYAQCIKRLKGFDPPENFSEAILCLVFVQGLDSSYVAFKESILLEDAKDIKLLKIIKQGREWKSGI